MLKYKNNWEVDREYEIFNKRFPNNFNYILHCYYRMLLYIVFGQSTIIPTPLIPF